MKEVWICIHSEFKDQAILALVKSGYSVKCKESNGVEFVVFESPENNLKDTLPTEEKGAINVPYRNPWDSLIQEIGTWQGEWRRFEAEGLIKPDNQEQFIERMKKRYSLKWEQVL